MSKRKRKDESSEEEYSTASSSGSYYSSSSSTPPKKKKSSTKKVSKGKSSKKSKGKSASKSKKSSKSSKKDKKKKPKGKRARKPEGYPKGVKSAYIFYTNEIRPKVKEKNPEIKFGELSKMLGQMWKVTDEEERKKFVALNLEDKVRYEKEVAEYKNKHPDKDSESGSSSSSSSSKKKKKPKKKRKVDPNAPKKPPNSYLIFCNDQRAKVKGELEAANDKTQLSKEMGKRWNALPDEEKKPYIEQATKLAQDHKLVVEAYKKSLEGGTVQPQPTPTESKDPEKDNAKDTKTPADESSGSYESSSN
jgi:hypothetical protein